MNINSRSAIKITLIYFVFSAIWILGSDSLLLLLSSDIYQFQYISLIKGIFFILTSSLIIYILVKHETQMIAKANLNIDNLSSRDFRTGLYNRKTYLEDISNIDDHIDNICMIIIDINGLKVINEVYSDETGDDVLIYLAKLLKKTFKEKGKVYRIGGDEFVVILNESDATKINNEVDVLYTTILKQEIVKLNFTISLGYSTSHDNVSNIKEIYAIAFDRMLKNKLVEANSSQSSIVASLKATLFERSDETEEHANRIGNYATMIGKKLGLSHSKISELQLLGYLHDIGKVGISDAILFKPGRLTELEMNRMKQHPIIGYKIASGIHQLENVAYTIMTHHERWDGKGYPKGLKKIEIPLLSRIISVVDAYDAMTNDRCYKKAMSKEKAITELIDNAGTQFDPDIVKTFIGLIKESDKNPSHVA
ncbi:diguanylate cyclase [Mycoplasmatota bacterium WC30]